MLDRIVRRFAGVLLAIAPILAATAIGSPAVSAATHRAPSRSGVICHLTGASWHIKKYHPTKQRDANGNTIYKPARGDRYRVLVADQAFCPTVARWLPRLTNATPDKTLSGHQVGRIHIPPGYGYIFQSPPGYLCIGAMDDNRPNHDGDNPHQGSCVGVGNGARTRPIFVWFGALPPQ